MNTHMLSLANVETIVNILRPEILESPAFLNADVLANLGINAITGIQFQESQIVYTREAGTTRRYDERDKEEVGSSAGNLIERKLEVTLSWNRYFDNIQCYREKVPFALSAENTFEAPNSEVAIRGIIASFSEDIFANLFHGNKKGSNKALSLYDGFYTKISELVNKGEVKVVNGGQIVIGGTSKQANWTAFKNWVNALPTRLKAAKELVVLASDEAKAEIVEGYLTTYVHMQNINEVDKPDFRFTTMPNVKLVSHPVLGKGSFLVATLPGNLDFGVDSLNNQSQVFVEKNPKDLNEFVYQIQSAQGVRIRRTDASALAVNNADMNTPLLDIQGDYMTGRITLYADAAQGSVQSSVADLSDVKAGTSITLTAKPESGFKFKEWSDGNKESSRTWIATGAPTNLTAIFEANV